MKTVLIFVLIGCATLMLNSCKKYEGEGGKSSISGNIMIDEKLYLNGIYNATVSYNGATEDVYIVYGDGKTTPDDKVECGFDGSFEFNYLQPGKYTVYAYSEIFHSGASVTNNDDDYYTNEVVSQTIELKKKEDIDLGVITLIR
jgi:hypothetical protein